ncbi:MAG: hypothetical protein DMD80_20400 [Candidatus Rokuibacteriota bacterium]|nr:MAG: hypothetical protein DMD80_20400 [Candidatus Rokubacteria bacterium]PYN28464.1 MAG: hypothetical protein DMD76_04890 [Candidatus Rokubacteria bacterium]
MVIRLSLGLVVALVLALLAPADAQQPTADTKAAKGVKARNLVTSLGGFSATVNAPILLTGQTIELEPGGHTGRLQFRVPTFVYVIEGILTTEYETGPVGIAGAQYHAAGQSYMDNGGWWHNAFNRTDKPVKYLILHVGYPGRPDPIVRPDAE